MEKKIIKMLVLEEREIEMSKETFSDMMTDRDLKQCDTCGLYFSRIEHYGAVNNLKRCVRCYGIKLKAKKVKEGADAKRRKKTAEVKEKWEGVE